MKFKNGDKFQGQFKDGRPCGQGVMKYQYSLPGPQGGVDFEEASYEGSFKAGKREGHGTLQWTDTTYFTGQWKND